MSNTTHAPQPEIAPGDELDVPEASPSPESCVLYLNLWGTTAKLLEADDGGDLLRPGDVARCQAHFAALVATALESKTEIDLKGEPGSLADAGGFAAVSQEVFAGVFGDFAYVVSSSPNRLAEIAIEIFGGMLVSNGRFEMWPLRGAISRGPIKAIPSTCLAHRETGQRTHHQTFPWRGEALVRAAGLEKAAPKGMRVVLDSNVASSLEGFHFRSLDVRGQSAFELNWLASANLDRTLPDGRRLRDALDAASLSLMEAGTNYCQQLSASLSDLTRWSRHRHERSERGRP